MRKIFVFISFFLLSIMISGCGTLTGIPSHGGGKRFAIEQQLVSASVRGALKKIDISALRGKVVYVQLTAINDQGGGNLSGGRGQLLFGLQGTTESSPITTTTNNFEIFDLSSSSSGGVTTVSEGGSDTSSRTLNNQDESSSVSTANTSSSSSSSNSSGSSSNNSQQTTVNGGSTNTTTTDSTTTIGGNTTTNSGTTTTDSSSTTNTNTNATTTTGNVTTNQTGGSNSTQTGTSTTTNNNTTIVGDSTNTSTGTTTTVIGDSTDTTNSSSNSTNSNQSSQSSSSSGSTTTQGNNLLSSISDFDSSTRNFQTSTTSEHGSSTNQVVSPLPTETESQTKGSGYKITYGAEFRGQGNYQNFNVPVSDVAILQSLVRSYLYLNDVIVTLDPNSPSIEAVLYVNVDVFGSIRSRFDTVVYNKETVKVRTAIEFMAVNPKNLTLLMPPQVGAYEASYDEKYAFWIGPLNKESKRYSHQTMDQGLMVGFNDVGDEKINRDKDRLDAFNSTIEKQELQIQSLREEQRLLRMVERQAREIESLRNEISRTKAFLKFSTKAADQSSTQN